MPFFVYCCNKYVGNAWIRHWTVAEKGVASEFPDVIDQARLPEVISIKDEAVRLAPVLPRPEWRSPF